MYEDVMTCKDEWAVKLTHEDVVALSYTKPLKFFKEKNENKILNVFDNLLELTNLKGSNVLTIIVSEDFLNNKDLDYFADMLNESGEEKLIKNKTAIITKIKSDKKTYDVFVVKDGIRLTTALKKLNVENDLYEDDIFSEIDLSNDIKEISFSKSIKTFLNGYLKYEKENFVFKESIDEDKIDKKVYIEIPEDKLFKFTGVKVIRKNYLLSDFIKKFSNERDIEVDALDLAMDYFGTGVKFKNISTVIKFLDRVSTESKGCSLNSSERKSLKTIKKTLVELKKIEVTYYVRNDSYKQVKCPHHRAGHWRHYKNGKKTWVESSYIHKDKI